MDSSPNIADHSGTSESNAFELSATPVEGLPYAGNSERWHPKLTVYRLLIICLTAGSGLAKAILAYRGETTAPITIEWVFGVVVLLV
jgi:hypothetical protein